ncbi:hypothetical protein EYF80_031577 [Liparis tanakae]|uniref:Uncharacterized protein n=1 Tax=Liparis tanakae TaxID=230148 RepID=A0A4Z2GX40_9TELE|nr:hypothetical protein EYF80_031577 [Liparis tanakae]
MVLQLTPRRVPQTAAGQISSCSIPLKIGYGLHGMPSVLIANALPFFPALQSIMLLLFALAAVRRERMVTVVNKAHLVDWYSPAVLLQSGLPISRRLVAAKSSKLKLHCQLGATGLPPIRSQRDSQQGHDSEWPQAPSRWDLTEKLKNEDRTDSSSIE